jgi:peptide chain release factor 1
MIEKLSQIEKTHEELTQRLTDPAVLTDHKAYTEINKALSEIDPTVKLYREYIRVSRQREETEEMLASLSKEDELYDMAREERDQLTQKLADLEEQLRVEMMPKDPNDDRNVVLEIRAGTGGDEAALFAGDLFRMYQRYAENQGWRVEIISASPSDVGGFKEVIASVSGQGVFAKLKFESGVHRVQRVPATESGGRIHTSAATVAVLPEAEDVDVHIEDKDLRIDVYRSSGPGGQSVNTTDSAVRITHLPTGIVVIQQDEKSQHKNKAKALKVLRTRLYEMERERLASERAGARKSMVGSGDRSERIRTYNFPQGRVTDHRINLTLHRLPEILEGPGLGELIDALTAEDQAKRLAALGE